MVKGASKELSLLIHSDLIRCVACVLSARRERIKIEK